jgi:hypothetical protein
MFHLPPLVDVIGAYYDGKEVIEENNIARIIDCMWDLGKAAYYAEQFSNIIPASNDNMIDFVQEYRKSPIFDFHEEFENTEDLPRYTALEKAKKDPNISDFSRHILYFPNPMALQPKHIMRFVHELLIYAKWKPRHIANIFRDFYIDPKYKWPIDFFKYPAEEKSNFWVRTFSALTLWKTEN